MHLELRVVLHASCWLEQLGNPFATGYALPIFGIEDRPVIDADVNILKSINNALAALPLDVGEAAVGAAVDGTLADVHERK